LVWTGSDETKLAQAITLHKQIILYTIG